MIGWLRFTKDDTNQVVGTGIIVAALHFGRDFVVGLSHDLGKIDPGRVISPGAEWFDVGHRWKGNCTSPAGLGSFLAVSEFEGFAVSIGNLKVLNSGGRGERRQGPWSKVRKEQPETCRNLTGILQVVSTNVIKLG